MPYSLEGKEAILLFFSRFPFLLFQICSKKNLLCRLLLLSPLQPLDDSTVTASSTKALRG